MSEATGGRGARDVVHALIERGELVESAPGHVLLRGSVLELFEALDRCFRRIAVEGGFREWRVPAGLPLTTLERARHLETFPQWLTLVAHLGDEPEVVDAVARGRDGAVPGAHAVVPDGIVLPSALCYHTYAHFADATVELERITVCGSCWRREDELRPLERCASFTMRELVLIGSGDAVRDFRAWSTDRVRRLAEELGLGPRTEPASDPFYAPTARGRQLLQQVKGLKTELLLDIGDGRRVAAASFNDHEHFFGGCFAITLADGSAASSGCTAFGIERWVLAFLVAHGVDAAGWPDLNSLNEGIR